MSKDMSEPFEQEDPFSDDDVPESLEDMSVSSEGYSPTLAEIRESLMLKRNPPEVAETRFSEDDNMSVTAEYMSESSEYDFLPSLADICGSPQKKNPSDIAGPSQGNVVDIRPSDLLGLPRFTFVYTLKPAIFLKFAIEALSDPQFNDNESGRLDVDENGFNITVQNLSNTYVGHLRLNPPNFRCFKRLMGKRFSFRGLSQELARVEDASFVFVNHRKEIGKLDFFGAAYVQFSAELHPNSAEIRVFPDLSFFCEATIPPNDFRLMVKHLRQEQMPKQVTVNIRENTATLKVGSEGSWEANYPMLGGTGMEAGKSYSACFRWTNAELLQKASELDVGLVVGLHTKQCRYISLRFMLRELGYLEYLMQPVS